eukprot:m.261585 g.261585  ORF g.261585 m.261585 type:complete len:274 (-) comp42460_c0_seq1:104-925(-)
MDEYGKVRSGSLKLKGQKKMKKKGKRTGSKKAAKTDFDDLEIRHGQFWLVKTFEHMLGNVLLETHAGGYITALDDGSVTATLPRPPDNEPENMPEPQDIVIMMKVNDSRVAFKTAYGRYISSAPDSGVVEARTEAMGVRELWQPMIKGDGVVQFRSADKKYLSAMIPGQPCKADSDSSSDPGTEFRIHSGASLETAKPKKRDAYEIEGGSLKSMEESHVKKFQSFQNLCFREDSKIKVSGDSRKKLKVAHTDGKLHQELLDRRSKIKADRYCK